APAAESGQVTALYPKDDGAEVGGIAWTEWIAWNIVSSSHCEPLVGTERQRPAVFDHGVDERSLDLARVSLGRVVEHARIDVHRGCGGNLVGGQRPGAG